MKKLHYRSGKRQSISRIHVVEGIELSIDENDGSDFQRTETRELLVVPYTLYTANAVQSVQAPRRSCDLITLSNGGGSFTDQVADADAKDEIAGLQLDGNLLKVIGNVNATTFDLSETHRKSCLGRFIGINGILPENT